MVTRYRFTTLWYRQSLGDTQAVPFAVIVESKRYVYCIGLHMKGGDSVAGEVLANFPAVLKERVEAAAHEAHGKGLALDVLLRDFAWNVEAEALRSSYSFSSIAEFAHHLFVKRVENRTDADKRRTDQQPLSIFAFDLPSPAFVSA